MSLSHPAEQDLIRKARSGDEQAFEQLVLQFTPKLYRVIRRIVDDSTEAENLVQETFFRFWKGLHRYQEERPLLPYLVTIALNLGRDQRRKSRFLDFGDFEQRQNNFIDSRAGPDALVEQAELLQALAEAVARLPANYRVVIALRYDAGMSYQEIAAALAIPLNTVRTHLRRAKEHLQKVLEEGCHGQDG